MGPDVLPRLKLKQSGGGFHWSSPRLPRKNEYWSVAPPGQGGRRGGLYRTALAKAFVKQLRIQLIADGHDLAPGRPLITTGRWALDVVVFVPRAHKTGILAGCPLMDSDACLAPLKDSLELAGVLPETKGDGLIDTDTTIRLYRPFRPGLLFQLRSLGQQPLDDLDGLLESMESFGRRARSLLCEEPPADHDHDRIA